MKAKEKAKELLDRFKKLVPDDFGGMDDKLAIQCALICVDETLNCIQLVMFENMEGKTWINNAIKYWEEVKSEIEKV